MKNILLAIMTVIVLLSNSLLSQPIMVWDEVYSLANLQDHPIKIMIDDSMNIFIVGRSAITNYPQTNFDALVLKYNEYGLLQWVRTHSLSYSGTDGDYFVNLIKCDSGKVLVAGTMQTSSGLRGLNIQYGASGDTIWMKDFEFSFSYSNQIYGNYLQKYFIADKYYSGKGLVIVSYDRDGSNESINYSNELSGFINKIQFKEEEDSLYIFTCYTKTISSN